MTYIDNNCIVVGKAIQQPQQRDHCLLHACIIIEKYSFASFEEQIRWKMSSHWLSGIACCMMLFDVHVCNRIHNDITAYKLLTFIIPFIYMHVYACIVLV